MKKFSLLLGIVVAIAWMAVGASATNATNDKITICHVAGLASDPANYITLNLPYPAVYGPGGHFNENGTTQAGHEQDTLGACNPPPPPHDECPLIPGNQPEGYDCTPEPPPCTVNCEPPPPPPCTVNCTPPPPPVERCPPGMFPTNGKDGEPGNDECEYPPTTTTPTTPTPAAPSGSSTPTGTTPTVTPPPTVVVTSKPPKVVKVKVVAKSVKKTKLTGNPKKDNCKELKNALLKCKVGGKTIVVVQGSG